MSRKKGKEIGADLYRSDFTERTKKSSTAFDDAIKRRDAASTEEEKAQIQKNDVEPNYADMFAHPYYFRDSYNDSSLFWKLNLSWWGDLPDYTDDDAVLHPEGIKRLEKEVRARAELLAKNVEDLPDTADDRLSKRYFFSKFDALLDFLKQAHEGGHTIRCSC